MASIFALFMLLKPVLPVIEYAIDYDYIATVLCINKDKPELKCNGKCHLMKELAKSSQEDGEQSHEKRAAASESHILFFEEILDFGLEAQVFPLAERSPYIFYPNLYSHLDSRSIFRPPLF